MTPDMAVVTPLNNPGGPEGYTVTVDEQLLNTYCSWNVIANQQLGSTPVQARGILQRPEEQSRTGGCQSSSVEGLA